jgi:AcrR family transcriptional regulator
VTAARGLFAAKGYDGTTMRDIAREAQVNPALIHHFFGTKERVFVAALGLPFTPADLLPTLLAGPRESFGERLVRAFLTVWDNPEHRLSLVALVRSATTNEQAAQTLRQFLSSTLLRGIADGLGVPRLRVAAAASQLVGMALLRFVLRIEPLASASEQELVELIAPVVQGYVDRPEPGP